MIDTSTIKLYTNSKITPRKNFVIDDLADYLATLSTPLTLTKFQYIKHALNLEIKIPLDQKYLDYDRTAKYDYCSIQNSDQTKIVYYFVMDMEWRGMNTLKLTLAMDTMNTFAYGTDYVLDDKTKINRQHKNRFIKRTYSYTGQFYAGSVSQEYNSTLNFTQWNFESIPYEELIGATVTNVSITCTPDSGTAIPVATTFSVVITSTGVIKFFAIYNGNVASVHVSATIDLEYTAPKYLRKIDLTSEGVTPVLYGTHKYDIVDDSQNWYLVYTSQGGSALRCYVCTDVKMSVDIPGDSQIIRSDLLASQFYYIMPDDNNSYIIIKTNEGQSIVVYRELFSGSNDLVRYKIALEYWNDGATISYRTHKYMDIGAGFFYVSSSETLTTSSLTITTDDDVTYHTLSTSTHNVADILAGASGTINLTPTTETNYSISEVDRTASGLIKIIKIPYKPVNSYTGFKYDSNTMHMMYLDNLSVSFEHNITENVYNPLEELDIDLTNIAITDLRNANYESKLFHSDYYQPKFIYDSFTLVFALERQNLDGYVYNNNFHITFNVSNTINSKFMFTFTDYNVDGLALEDYSNILCVARNNEITILNSSYIDYLRMGYNYDVKSRERQETGQWIGTGLSLVGAVVSFATAAYTGGAGVAAGVALATSAMAQLVSAVNTTAQAEANHTQKLAQLRQQKTSVYGADDVDLMSKYTGNKAKFMLYQCSDKMKSVLFDLFFYTGYVDGTMGTPVINNRRRFNFLSCEPVFKSVDNIPEDLLSDIELKMNAGVTFIHHYNSEWDLDQKYENWEVSLT